MLAYVPRIHAFLVAKQGVGGRDKPGHDGREVVPGRKKQMAGREARPLKSVE